MPENAWAHCGVGEIGRLLVQPTSTSTRPSSFTGCHLTVLLCSFGKFTESVLYTVSVGLEFATLVDEITDHLD